jgi:hypothetical protein
VVQRRWRHNQVKAAVGKRQPACVGGGRNRNRQGPSRNQPRYPTGRYPALKLGG